MRYKIAIDASRSKSGGGKAHLIGILNELDPTRFNIDQIHVWSYRTLLNDLPDEPWLVKHCPEATEKSILGQLWWQYNTLHKEVEEQGCQVLLNTSAGTVCQFQPAVTMSRDMLSFERREIARFGFGREWLRLFILRYTQKKSLKDSTGALFLTKYAADTIQTWTGKIPTYRIIPHGTGQNFRNNKLKISFPINGEREIKCLYVSNVDRYKHQWNVAKAIYNLRKKGHHISLRLVGGGKGPAQARLEKVLEEIDPNSEFVVQDIFLKHQQIPPIISESDIFIFASSCENMPNTLVEAMACGIPIACSNLGPMPEVLLDGGVYFDPEDVESITNSVEILINEKEKREFSAKRSKELSKQYSWKRCAHETMNYLIDIYKKGKK